MASYFGEVRPLSSRAVEDEDKEDDEDQPQYEVSMEKSEDDNAQLKPKLIIFSVGEISSVFAKSHFLSDNPNRVSFIKYSLESYNEDLTFYTGMSTRIVKNITAVSIFTVTSDVLICEISKPIPEEICYEVTELIFKEYCPSEVLILSSKHMATFKGENPSLSDTPFLKALKTSTFSRSYSCSIPRLAAPNFLSNIAASVLIKCEISKLPALCVVSYVETDAVDNLNVHSFEEILKEPILAKVPLNADAKERVNKVVKVKQSAESNIYM